MVCSTLEAKVGAPKQSLLSTSHLAPDKTKQANPPTALVYCSPLFIICSKNPTLFSHGKRATFSGFKQPPHRFTFPRA
ncbi:hypothetical protein L1887_24221 [Cichorium endivia]|nr:hypothetical protein L1887_24221 [Cichorium endivia]